MRGNRKTDSRPEIALRSALHRRGLRFRKNVRPEPDINCNVDIVFRGPRLAVFLDGCFWHRCPEHGTTPSTNVTYWMAKIARNVERDRANDELLTRRGWRVLHVWEHEPPMEAASRIEAELQRLS
jgi:DNA mismatch endonuclease (patch repair protein)